MPEQFDNVALEEIITAFKEYALSDIKFNKDRPIAAAILIACLLDQLSCFFYKGGKGRDRATKFIENYLPQYKEIGLYDILRNPMVHNYSIKGNYSVSSDPIFAGTGICVTMEGIIYIPALIEDLEQAIALAVNDLRTKPAIKKIALEWYRRHKVLGFSHLTVYTSDHIRKLWAYYEPQIRSHRIFQDGYFEIALKITKVNGDGGLVNVAIKELNGDKKDTTLSINNFALVLGFTPPDEYLTSIEA